jgi:hypothetical protein
MLKCTDLAYARNDKGEVVKIERYERVYLNYGPDDPVVERDKTVNKVSIGKVMVPRDSKSVHDGNALMAQAIAYFQSDLAKAEPMLALLDCLDYGANLKNKPTLTVDKPIDEDKAFEAAAKKLMLTRPGKFASLADAITAVKAFMS